MNPTPTNASEKLILIGTATPPQKSSRGIYAVRLDTVTGAFAEPSLAITTPNPGFLDRHPEKNVLYSIGELPIGGGKTVGAVASFTLESQSGDLLLLNTQPSGGGKVSHIAVDATGKLLVSVSYSGGQISAFEILNGGELRAPTAVLKTVGKLGPRSDRQNAPHPHSATFSPDNRRVYICDLGLDRIFYYDVHLDTSTITLAGHVDTAPGAGPRHSKFSADGRFFYVINELNSSITTYAVDEKTGALKPLQSINTLPENFASPNTSAEIRIHPNGRFVYGSNRGHDSIAVFKRDPDAGTLTLIEIVPCGGLHPRNFGLSPDGAWLVCANMNSDTLTSFRIDSVTGKLTPTGATPAKVDVGTCVLFLN